MNYLIQILLILLIIQPNFKKPIHYRSKPDLYKLHFNSDSTFLYEFNGGFHLRYAEGNWKTLNRNTILLLSKYLDFNYLPIRVIENEVSNNDSILIELICNIPENDQFYSYSMMTNDSIIYSKNRLFTLSSKSDSSRINFSIYFNCYNCMKLPLRTSIKTQNYFIDNKSSHYKVLLDVDSRYFYNEVINNDSIILKRNKLFWPKKNLTLYQY